ncbi:MAG: TetR/AcrR family transcriptional regulator [Pseudomonadota bacterium]
MTEPTDPVLWKEPTQERGRKRVAAILHAVRAQIIEAGHLDFKMASVAEEAGVPIGSVYQFFPTRTALLACLFAKEMEPIDRSLREALDCVETLEAFSDHMAGLLRTHAKLVREAPVLAILLTSPGQHPAIQAADLKNSQANADSIASRLLELAGPSADEAAIRNTSLLVCHLWGEVIRLEGLVSDVSSTNAMVDAFGAMIRTRFEELLLRG